MYLPINTGEERAEEKGAAGEEQKDRKTKE
jgi:hypothetical protein